MTVELAPIAVNAMGGDETKDLGYSRAAVRGAMEAASAGVDVVLVGDQAVLPDNTGLPIVHTPDYIAMDAHDFSATVSGDRREARTSIVRAVRGHKEGEFRGVVCAGSTGGVMAAATLILGRVKGINRPAIPTRLPYVSPDGKVSAKILLDSGANPDTTPRQFVDNALLGAVYAEACSEGFTTPRVGILTNGTEEGKGSETDRQVYAFLKEYGARLGIDFVGNLEGTDIFGGTRVDVILANGLTGNIVLKTAEGLGAMIKAVLFGSMQGATPEEAAAFELIAPRMIVPLTEAISKNKVGGAPLLGVTGNVVIAHGSSSAEGVKNAIMQADRLASAGLVAAIERRVAICGDTLKAIGAPRQPQATTDRK